MDPLRPFSQVAQRVSIRYTATYLIVVVFAVGVFCLLLAASVADVLRVVLAALGSVCVLAALVASGYLVFLRPELLRSEDHLRFMKVVDWLADPNLDEEAAKRRDQVLPLLQGRRSAKMNKAINPSDDHEDDA